LAVHPNFGATANLQSSVKEHVVMTQVISGGSVRLGSPPVRIPSRRASALRKQIIPWLFVLPILLINLVVIIGPSLGAIAASLTDWNGMTTANFIGLANYQRLLSDPDYGRALVNNLTWMSFFLSIPILLALIAASLLAPIKRGGLFLRTALFIPYVLPSVINANIWRNLLRVHKSIKSRAQGRERG